MQASHQSNSQQQSTLQKECSHASICQQRMKPCAVTICHHQQAHCWTLDFVDNQPDRRQAVTALPGPAHAGKRGTGSVAAVLDRGALKHRLVSRGGRMIGRSSFALTFAQAPSPFSTTSVIAQPLGSLPLSTFSITMVAVKVVATLKILKSLESQN